VHFLCATLYDYDDDNNNTNANVYGGWCCHHGRTIARVHPVHLMNAERRQPESKPNDLGCDRESACRLPESTPTVAIYYYYSSRKLILILPYNGW